MSRCINLIMVSIFLQENGQKLMKYFKIRTVIQNYKHDIDRKLSLTLESLPQQIKNETTHFLNNFIHVILC